MRQACRVVRSLGAGPVPHASLVDQHLVITAADAGQPSAVVRGERNFPANAPHLGRVGVFGYRSMKSTLPRCAVDPFADQRSPLSTGGGCVQGLKSVTLRVIPRAESHIEGRVWGV